MKVSEYKNDEFLKKYEERVKIHKLVPFKKIIALLSPLQNKKILDLGCGSGELTFELAKNGSKVVGIDKSKKWIDACKKQYCNLENLEFIQLDAQIYQLFQADLLMRLL